MRKRNATSRHLISVDLTPMIDVVFQLIIFFMFTSQFGDLRRTEVDLPREQGDEQAEKARPAMIIDLTSTGEYYFESERLSLLEIERIVKLTMSKHEGEAPFDVLVRPDRSAPAVHLDRLLIRLANVGVQRWKIATIDDGGGS